VNHAAHPLQDHDPDEIGGHRLLGPPGTRLKRWLEFDSEVVGAWEGLLIDGSRTMLDLPERERRKSVTR